MSDPRRTPDDDDPRQSTEKGRRRGRWLLPLIFLLVLAVIVGYLLLVSTRGTDDEGEIFGGLGAPPAAVAAAP